MAEPAIVVVGAGNRGQTYAASVQRFGGRVVGVCEPDAHRRNRFGDDYGIPMTSRWESWTELVDREPVADAAVIATMDRGHVEPAMALARAGYALLVEKPMATDPVTARRLVDVVKDEGVLFAVCHVLRYTPYTQLLKGLVDQGRLGRLVSVEHLEPVGWWHFAHSYVRGNWRREDSSGPLLLTKCSHDVDWLTFVSGREVRRVSSFGSLTHFRPSSRPPGAASRCLDCSVESGCPYSAPRFYLPKVGDPAALEWPLRVISQDTTADGVLRALEDGPYGRCVYDCDNDVVDHQVVNLEYDDGMTASFTVTAFSQAMHRQTRLFGTHGMAEGDGRRVTITDFRDGQIRTYDSGAVGGAHADAGHDGGDDGVVSAFLAALVSGDRSHVLSGPDESLRGHEVVWAAERARLSGAVVSI